MKSGALLGNVAFYAWMIGLVLLWGRLVTLRVDFLEMSEMEMVVYLLVQR